MTQVAQQQEQVQEPVQQAQAVKKKWGIKEYINSPYILLLIPLLVGGFFLVRNPQYVALAMNYPFAAAFILAIPVALFIIKLVINFFSVIEQWVRLQFEKARNAKRGQFLEFVIAVFMFVSVTEAGPMFNKLQGYALGGALGYITVFAFDLVAVVCMKSRAKMLRKGHDGKAHIYQLGVWLCALVSVFANLYEAIQNATALSTRNPLTFFAPLAGIAFPVMIIFLSYATDADEDDVDDPEVYKTEQEKRVAFVKAKREIAEAILQEKIQMNLLKGREFFLKGWFFTKKKMNAVIEVATQQVMDNIKSELTTLKKAFVDDASKEVKATYKSQIEQMQSEIANLKQQNQTLQTARTEDQREFARRIEQLQVFVNQQIEQQNGVIAQQQIVVRSQFDERGQQFGERLIELTDTCVERVLSIVREELDTEEENDDSEHGDSEENEGSSNAVAGYGSAVRSETETSSTKAPSKRYGSRSARTKKRGKVTRKTVKIPAVDLVREVLDENPYTTVSEIALRTGLSKGTVSPLRTQLLKQMGIITSSFEQVEDEQKAFDDESVDRSDEHSADDEIEQNIVVA